MSNVYACEFLPSPLLSGDGSRVQCLCWEGVARWISLQGSLERELAPVLMKTPEEADISTDHLIHGNKILYLEPVKYF